MPVTIKKTKAKAKPAVAPKTVDPVVAKVDRLAEIHRVINPLVPLTKEYEKITKELRGMAKDKPNGEVVTFAGTEMVYSLDPCKKERTIKDKAKAFALLSKTCGGVEKAIELVSFKLEDLDKYLTPAEIAEVVAEDNTGSRVAKLVSKL